jgi:hypothetical protein
VLAPPPGSAPALVRPTQQAQTSAQEPTTPPQSSTPVESIPPQSDPKDALT